MNLSFDSARLARLLAEINAFGHDPVTGGFDRTAFSPADMAVRAHFLKTMRRDGLVAHMDAAGNVVGRLGSENAPAIMVGSHLDTVPTGGAFDGALGCAAALECVRSIRDAAIPLAHPIEVVATADEEGRFGGMLGSQALAGTLPPGWAERASDPQGVALDDAMRAAGLDIAALPSAARRPGSIRAFLELHIEQGPVLAAAGCPLGIATAVSGCTVLDIRLTGVSNHSGTTPMDMRHDAFVGLATIGAALPDVARSVGGPDSRLTIGEVSLFPNAAHTIPGTANATVIVRDTGAATMQALAVAVADLTRSAAEAHGLEAVIRERSSLAPVALDPRLASLLASEANRLGVDVLRMPSGAGHDAQTMASLCPAALLFVPSRDGVSHSPAEHSEWSDIERGVEVLLRTLLVLAGECLQS